MSALEPLDEFQYHHRLLQAGGVALVLFTSPDCGACRTVERLLPGIAPAGTQLFKVDVLHATALARAFDIFHLPALLLYRDGRFHAVLGCEATAAKLPACILAALDQPAQEEP